MSSSSKPPPPDPKRKSDHAGLVTREPKGVMDAIPTEAEGDALFDELFGSDPYEDDAVSTNQPPESTAAVSAEPASLEPETHRQERPAFDGTPLGLGPVALGPPTEQDEDIETVRPPAPPEGSELPEPTLGELAAAQAGDGIEDFETGEYQELSDTNELPKARLPRDEPVPYAAPYEMPPVEESDEIHIADEVVLEDDTPEPTPYGPSLTTESDEGSSGIDFTEAVRPSSRSPLGAVDEVDSTPFEVADDDDEDDAATMMVSPGALNIPGVQREDLPPTPTRPQVAPDLPRPPPPAPPQRKPPVEPTPLMGGVEERASTPESDAPEAVVAEVDSEVVEMDDLDDADLEAAQLDADDGGEMDVADYQVDDGHELAYEDVGGQDAVVSLMQQGERDAWVTRAGWLYDEAPDASAPAERARALLVVSEILAMAGEDERAESVAREALQLAPSSPMVHRQLRGLLMARGRWVEVADALDAEARVAPNAEAKLHAAYLGAEVARITLGDPEGAHRRLDQAERVNRADLRVQLARLMRSLATSDEVPEVSPVAGDAAEALKSALAVLEAIRSDGMSGDATDSAYATVLRTRAALRKRTMPEVIAGLKTLEGYEEFAPGAAWLIASLAAPHAELRDAAIDALARVGEGSHGMMAVRARAARALEAGDAAAMVVVANEAPEGVLSAGERLILASLAGRALDDHTSWLGQVAHDADHAPLAAASAALLLGSGEATTFAVGDANNRAAAALGRYLGSTARHELESKRPPVESEDVDVDLGDAVVRADDLGAPEGFDPALCESAVQLLDVDAGHGVARAVMLEHFHSTGQFGRMASALCPEDAVELGRERATVAALLAELSGDQDELREQIQRALNFAPEDIALTRLAMTGTDPVVAATTLLQYADAQTDPARTAIALTEAGLRLMEEEGQEADGEAILRRAAELQPDIPIAPFIGMYIAAALGDEAGEQFWLTQRRAGAVEPADAAGDLVRQALRLPDDESAERVSLLAEAHRVRPDDYTLRDLYEQAAGVVDDRAAWLMDRAEQAGSDGVAMALEAALARELEGDIEQAATCVARAVEAGDTALAPIFARRYALFGFGADAVVEALAAEMRQAGDARQRADLLELTSRIELGRGDAAKAREALVEIVEQVPDHLPALHTLEAFAFESGSLEGLESVELAIARKLDGPTAVGHAMLAARILERTKGWEHTFEAVQIAASSDPNNIWARRNLAAHARIRGDHATVASLQRSLTETVSTPIDQVTLLLRSGEASLAGEELEAASEALTDVINVWPRHPVALWERASLLERAGDAEAAAQAYEELALATQAPDGRCAMLYRAAVLWLSLENNEGQEEGQRLLEAVSTIDPNHGDTFERLQAIYLAVGAKRELADLLASRLETVTDPDERVKLEVMRGRMLVEAGSAAEAREALSAALEANPDNPEALSAYADVCAAEGEWEAVEEAIIALGRLVSDPLKQVDIYLRLGDLYHEHLPNAERSEMAYQEVLKRAPDNARARQRLVDLYLEAGDVQRAFEQQNELVNAAKSAGEKCAATVRMAEIHEAAGDLKEAEQTLVKARRTFNKEAAPVEALYRFYRRNGQDPAADLLLERAQAEVRRGLGAGRFEGPLFAMAEAVANLRGQSDAAMIARATLSALEGEAVELEGAGVLAAQPDLDELVAPEVFTDAFRSLLRATGTVLDAAAPFDLKSLRAKPLPPPQQAVTDRIKELAAGYGLPDVQVYASNALGKVCMATHCDPPTLCLGLSLVTAEEAPVREFLVHRALKVLQTRSAALARTAPIDLWPLVAAYLKLHSPSFQPTGVDAGKVKAFHAQMAEVAPRAVDPQLNLLASEVIGSIGNRASSLNTVANAWGSRTGLLAMGDPAIAIDAIAWAAGNAQGPPAHGTERVRWIGRQAEARDLIVFSVSDEYAKARAKLGLELDAAAVEVEAFL